MSGRLTAVPPTGLAPAPAPSRSYTDATGMALLIEERAAGADLARSNVMVQAWTARFFLKAVSKPREALDYYYRAYFLDPDFYETEFVEARIARMVPSAELDACP